MSRAWDKVDKVEGECEHKLVLEALHMLLGRRMMGARMWTTLQYNSCLLLFLIFNFASGC